MKKLFGFLFTALLLLGCSSDDSSNNNNEDNGGDQNTVLNIKKLTTVNSLTDYTSVTYFNENGTVQRRLGFNTGQNESTSSYELYEYNSGQNLISIKLYDANGQFIRDWRLYTYDSQERLSAITDYGDGSHLPYHTSFMYETNRVDFLENETNKSGYVVFDSQQRIIETAHDDTGLGTFQQHSFIYENGKVIEISKGDGTIYNNTIDANTNPLFRDFIANPMQYMLIDQYLYDIDFTFHYSYLQNNTERVTSTTNSVVFELEETTYVYNSDNYPLSSSTTRHDGAVITRAFEYH